MDNKSPERQQYQMQKKGLEDIKKAIDDSNTGIKKVELVGAEIVTIKGAKGDQGDPGKTPKKGEDFWTPSDVDELVSSVLKRIVIPKPIPGKPGKDAAPLDYTIVEGYVRKYISKIKIPEPKPGKPGKPGKDADPVDYPKVVSEVLARVKIPEPKEVDYSSIKQVIREEVIRVAQQISPRTRILNSGGPTTRLTEISDVDPTGLEDGYVLVYDAETQKWIPGPGGGSSAWGSITGTITDQTDLINTIDNIAQSYATQWSNVTGGIQYGSRVGIGSGATTPAYSLHIATTGAGGFAVDPSANPSFGIGSNSSPLSYWQFQAISGQNQIDTTNRPFLIKATSFADMFFLDATSGKMALGTQTVSTGWLNMRPTSGRGLYIRPNGYNFGDTSNQAIMLENDGGTHRAQWSQRASDMTFGTITNQPLYFSQNASAVFQMLTDGNVNICRETVPGSTNGWRLRAMHRETSSYNVRKSTLSLFADANANTTTGFGPSMEFGGRMGATSNVSFARIDSLLGATGADLIFNTHNGTSLGEAMRITATNDLVVAGTISGRQKARVYSVASTSTLTPEIDTYDAFTVTALAANLTIANHSTSTPNDFDEMDIRILDNGTARTLTFGTNYVSGTNVTLPTTTVISTTLNLKFRWDSTKSKWVLLAKD